MSKLKAAAKRTSAEELKESIRSLLAVKPWSSGDWNLEELRDELESRGLKAKVASIYLTLRALGYSRKWVRR